jgi:hypothetical protein
MKTILVLRKVLATSVFVSGIVLYLLFATAHPFLHNHHIDGEHHHNCPACNFLTVASFSTVPETAIPSVFFQVDYQPLFDYQQPYQQTFCENHSVRGPPLVSA